MNENVDDFSTAVETRFRDFNDTVADAGAAIDDFLDEFASVTSVDDVSFGTIQSAAAGALGIDVTPGQLSDMIDAAISTAGSVQALVNQVNAQAAESQRSGGGSLGSGPGFGGNDDSGGGGAEADAVAVPTTNRGHDHEDDDWGSAGAFGQLRTLRSGGDVHLAANVPEADPGASGREDVQSLLDRKLYGRTGGHGTGRERLRAAHQYIGVQSEPPAVGCA